jgi:hypothetical protein
MPLSIHYSVRIPSFDCLQSGLLNMSYGNNMLIIIELSQ